MATDVSPDALEVANKNCVQLGANVELLQADLLQGVPKKDFDTLVANLPYIGTEEHAFMAENVEKHEPHLALLGGKDGLRLYERLFRQILEEDWAFNSILGEIGFSQGQDLKTLAEQFFPDARLTLRQDLEGLDRHFLLERK